MNIVVRTESGKYIVRPDTTWERDNEDVFLPEFVNGASFSPVLFARISKPGRSVGEQFADRYFDGVGFGVLLYPEDMIDGSPEGFACASCLDHTSFLPFPVKEKEALNGQDSAFVIEAGGNEVFRSGAADAAMIRKAIAEATRFIYIRTGDLIAIELAPRKALVSRNEKEICVKGDWKGERTVDFKVIL